MSGEFWSKMSMKNTKKQLVAELTKADSALLSHEKHLKRLEKENTELKKENEKLKEEVELKKDAWCPELILKDLYENTNYKDPSLTIKDYIQKIEAENEKLKKEIEEIKEQSVPKDFLFAERATADGKICLLKKKIAELKEQGKNDLEKACLETQFHTWRDTLHYSAPSVSEHHTEKDDCQYLNLYSNNQQLIKEIFDEIYSDPTERNLSYNVETRTYDEVESDDEDTE